MLECDLTINDRCTNLYTAGRSPFTKPEAIVLIALGMPMADYHNLLAQGYARWYPTSHPKSVHYGVSLAGAVFSYVSDIDTAWGLDALHNPSWPGIEAAPDPARQFLFIGLEGSGALGGGALTALAQLICCLADAHNLPINEQTVIVARDLNDTLIAPWAVPAGLIALAQAQCAGGGSTTDLVACCAETRADIAALSARVAELEAAVCAITAEDGPVAALQAAVDSLVGGLNELIGRVAALEAGAGAESAQYALLAQTIVQMQVCLDRVCPPESPAANIEYYGLALNVTALTPNWLALPTKVSDTVPPSAMTGPLWAASLSMTGVYTVEGYVRFAVADWCTGKQTWLDAIVDAGSIRLDTETIVTGGAQTVELRGTGTVQIPPDAHVHLSVQFNDPTLMIRVLDLAWIKIVKIA